MSNLYGSYFQELHPKKYKKDTPMNPLHLEMGLAWEDMLEDGLKERLIEVAGEDIERPKELQTTTGIYYSPDLLIYPDNGPTRLGEIKLTWMSSREWPTEPDTFFPTKFSKFDFQIRAYCYWLGLLDARIYAFHVNGEYAWMKRKKPAQSARDAAKQAAEEIVQPGGPQLLAFDLTYTQHELDETWLILESHGKSMGWLDAKGRVIDGAFSATGSH